jgi:hypothetical protein
MEATILLYSSNAVFIYQKHRRDGKVTKKLLLINKQKGNYLTVHKN